MKAYEELRGLGVERYPECRCAVGNDWEYKPYSNKYIIVCPQCGEEIDTENYKEDAEKMMILGPMFGRHFV